MVLAIGLSGMLPGTTALAGPPYVTDDPEPTDPGKWEIYGFATRTGFQHGAEGDGGFDINYGGAKNLQLSAVVSFAYSDAVGEPTHLGIADTEIGFKYKFVAQHAGSVLPDISAFPTLELPTAGRRFGSGRLGFSLPLWAQKDFGPWSVFGGGGWTLNPGPGNRNFTFGGLALTRMVTKSLSVGGEIYYQAADSRDTRSATGLGFGVSWQVAPKWAIIGSGGPMLEHRATAGEYAAYVALEFHN